MLPVFIGFTQDIVLVENNYAVTSNNSRNEFQKHTVKHTTKIDCRSSIVARVNAATSCA